jgi:hypothetical protein
MNMVVSITNQFTIFEIQHKQSIIGYTIMLIILCLFIILANNFDQNFYKFFRLF